MYINLLKGKNERCVSAKQMFKTGKIAVSFLLGLFTNNTGQITASTGPHSRLQDYSVFKGCQTETTTTTDQR